MLQGKPKLRSQLRKRSVRELQNVSLTLFVVINERDPENCVNYIKIQKSDLLS